MGDHGCGVLEHAAITKADLVEEVAKWGSRRSGRLIDETLETVRELARVETPHASAEPTLQDEVVRFCQNLLDGRAVGASRPTTTTIPLNGPQNHR